MTVYQAIKKLEDASEAEPRSTYADITENGKAESRAYIHWLRINAPWTSRSIPEWNALTKKPAKP